MDQGKDEKKVLDFATCVSSNMTLMNKIVKFNLPSAAKMADQVLERLKQKKSEECTDIELLMDAANNVGDMCKDLGMMTGNLTIMTAMIVNLLNERLPGNIVPASMGDLKNLVDYKHGG